MRTRCCSTRTRSGRWCPHPPRGRSQVSVRLVDLLEALGRLLHVVAIPVGVVEERQLLERFFYGCLVRLLIEAQHFEVLGAGRHCAALLSASGQPRAAQRAARKLGSAAWQRCSHLVESGELLMPANPLSALPNIFREHGFLLSPAYLSPHWYPRRSGGADEWGRLRGCSTASATRHGCPNTLSVRAQSVRQPVECVAAHVGAIDTSSTSFPARHAVKLVFETRATTSPRASKACT